MYVYPTSKDISVKPPSMHICMLPDACNVVSNIAELESQFKKASQSVLVVWIRRSSRLPISLGVHRLICFFRHKIALLVPWYTLPTRLEPLVACIEARKRMGLGV